MSSLKYKTRDMANSRGLSHVYFACHREDLKSILKSFQAKYSKNRTAPCGIQKSLSARGVGTEKSALFTEKTVFRQIR